MRRFAIIGAGSWGTTLCRLVAQQGFPVAIWGHNAAVVRQLQQERLNTAYLPGFRIPESVQASTNLEEVVTEADVVLMAVPSHVTRDIYKQMRPFVHPRMIFVSATKGIENESHKCMHDVIRDVLRDSFEPRFVSLSGPSFALEVAREHPTAVVAASTVSEYAEWVQKELSTSYFRIYSSTDITSVEIAGAVKNVMAIAAGVVVGLGWGYNSVVALATRGLAEMTRLAVALGGHAETLAGLAGMGDLMLTCMGALSRNRTVGVQLGKGRSLDQILSEMTMVAEGVNTTRATYELSQMLRIEMPITAGVFDMLYGAKPPRDVAEELMMRPLRREM